MTATTPYDEGYFERAEGSNYLNYGDDPGFLTIAALMRTLLPAGSKVLEEACAKGYFIKHARSLALDACGFDISEYAISKAVSEAASHVLVADALNVPWDDDVFDAVVSWEFLEHLTVETIGDALREIERVGKPGALTIHRIGIIRTDGRFPEGEDHDHTHTLMRDDEWWRMILHMRGWTRLSGIEAQFDQVFDARDWSGRFYIYRLPQE